MTSQHSQSGYGNPVVRFWNKVNKSGANCSTLGVCWEWTAGLFESGYGQFHHCGKNIKAHRYSYELHYGEITEGLSVLHKCDNRRCVRPDHLFVGNTLDNVTDMILKGRHPHGETNGQSKLTNKLVRYIRAKYVRGSSTHGSYALARELGVSQYVVMCVIHRKYWSHVE